MDSKHNIIAYTSSHTPEGMTDYVNFVDKVDTISELSYIISFVSNKQNVQALQELQQQKQADDTNFPFQCQQYQYIIENHILYFLKKYKYDALAHSIEDASDEYLRVTGFAKVEELEDANREVLGLYAKLASLLNNALYAAARDFKADEFDGRMGKWGYDEGFDEEFDESAGSMDTMVTDIQSFGLGEKL